MPIEPADRDVHVFRLGPGVSQVRPQFFGRLVDARRETDADSRWLVLTFEEGGEVRVLADGPAVWTEPERH